MHVFYVNGVYKAMLKDIKSINPSAILQSHFLLPTRKNPNVTKLCTHESSDSDRENVDYLREDHNIERM